MKRTFHPKKRPSTQKRGLNPLRKIFKTIKRKSTFIQIESPHNTSQFLIENGSTPFYEEEDDDIGMGFTPNSLMLFKNIENSIDGNTLNLRNFTSSSTQSEIEVVTPL